MLVTTSPMMHCTLLLSNIIKHKALFSLTLLSFRYEVEAKDMAQNCRCSSFICLLGLSSVVKQLIESYFPVKDPTKCDLYERVFNCTMVSRQHSSISEKSHIFCCSILPVEFLFHNNSPEQKNHYLPLVNAPVDE